MNIYAQISTTGEFGASIAKMLTKFCQNPIICREVIVQNQIGK